MASRSAQTPKRLTRASSVAASVRSVDTNATYISNTSKRTRAGRPAKSHAPAAADEELPGVISNQSFAYGAQSRVDVNENLEDGAAGLATALADNRRTDDVAPAIDADTISADASKSFGDQREGGLVAATMRAPPPRPTAARPAGLHTERRANRQPAAVAPNAAPGTFEVFWRMFLLWLHKILGWLRAFGLTNFLVSVLLVLVPIAILHPQTFAHFNPKSVLSPAHNATACSICHFEEIADMWSTIISKQDETQQFFTSRIDQWGPFMTRQQKTIDELSIDNAATKARVAKLELAVAEIQTNERTFAGRIESFAVDYFSNMIGAHTIQSLTSPTYVEPVSFINKMYKRLVYPETKGPNRVLNPWERVFGDCWCAADSSDKGKLQLGVKMPFAMYPEAIVLEYIDKRAAIEVTSAPKWIEVWANVQSADQRIAIEEARRADLALTTCTDWSEASKDGYEFVCVGRFYYDIDTPNGAITELLMPDLHQFGVPGVREMVVRVEENWGKEFTCLYRVRMHGRQAAQP